MPFSKMAKISSALSSRLNTATSSSVPINCCPPFELDSAPTMMGQSLGLMSTPPADPFSFSRTPSTYMRSVWLPNVAATKCHSPSLMGAVASTIDEVLLTKNSNLGTAAFRVNTRSKPLVWYCDLSIIRAQVVVPEFLTHVIKDISLVTSCSGISGTTTWDPCTNSRAIPS